jgi:5-methylcytosine-specific restriction endonuclease McrA
MSSNDKKNETLGMPHGTASGKLRKLVLFRQLQKYGDNVCVRCDEEIESADDLSIEHIKPWEGLSAELFWDLDNVAFSHLHCNRPHRTEGLRKIGPKGTAWCVRHQSFQPIETFYKSSKRWNGVKQYCSSCQKELDMRQDHILKDAA